MARRRGRRHPVLRLGGGRVRERPGALRRRRTERLGARAWQRADQTIALPFLSNTRNAPVPMATRLPSESRTFASAVALGRVRRTTPPPQVMRPALTPPR